MHRPNGFSLFWNRYQHQRVVANGIADGDRCALALSLTLGSEYEPRKEKQDISFRNLPNAKDPIRGAVVLDRYYAQAGQLAERLKTEWGPPDFAAAGPNAMKQIAGIPGVIFISHSWAYPHFSRISGLRFGDHIDLWNGSIMGSNSDSNGCAKRIRNAASVWLWRIR